MSVSLAGVLGLGSAIGGAVVGVAAAGAADGADGATAGAAGDPGAVGGACRLTRS